MCSRFLRWLQQFHRPTQRTKRQLKVRRFVPEIEMLEKRELISLATVSSVGPNHGASMSCSSDSVGSIFWKTFGPELARMR